MKVNKLKELDGKEIWTDAFYEKFGDRICVGIEYPYCVHKGKKFRSTSKEITNLWDDIIRQEFGSKS